MDRSSWRNSVYNEIIFREGPTPGLQYLSSFHKAFGQANLFCSPLQKAVHKACETCSYHYLSSLLSSLDMFIIRYAIEWASEGPLGKPAKEKLDRLKRYRGMRTSLKA